jgi:DHA2 family multidrug resistance protein
VSAAAVSTSGAPPAAPVKKIPWLGLIAVLLGTFISTLNTRFSSFGLADIRGAVHAGFDEGAWISTAQTVAQMMVAPIAVWIGGVYGPRRVLIGAALAFMIISAVEPFSQSLPELLIFQFLGGLSSGFFVPLTLSFILIAMPPKYWAYGIALYALNLDLSTNVSVALEGFYVDHLSWHWIYWQNVPLAAAMAWCLYVGVARTPPGADRPRPDLFGFVSGGVSLGLIYAALDQGNRLNWMDSGLIWGLLLSGAVLFTAFIIHEMRTAHPGVELKVVAKSPLPQLLTLITFLRLSLLSTAFLIPQFLTVVRGFRGLEVGQALAWVGVPQLVMCPFAGFMLRRSDPRFVSSVGFILICISCLMVAWTLTPLWGPDQFVPSALLQAVGQAFALSGIFFYAILHLTPEKRLTFGASIQTARLMGSEIGSAFVVTFNRVREQAASNHFGLHVQVGDFLVEQRLQVLTRVAARSGDPARASAKALGLLGAQVRVAATIQGVIDCYMAICLLTALALLLLVSQKAAPKGPASHKPLLQPKATAP